MVVTNDCAKIQQISFVSLKKIKKNQQIIQLADFQCNIFKILESHIREISSWEDCRST